MAQDPQEKLTDHAPGPGRVIQFPLGAGSFVDPTAGLPPMVRELRPLQWIKNLIVFAPLIFAQKVFEPSMLLLSLGAFVSFCAASSAIYLLNDIRDLAQDRFHPEKRFRPIAAGEIEQEAAAKVAIVAAVVALAVALLVGLEFTAVVLAYLILMGAYNFGLKSIVFIDVFAIAAGFLLRAGGGAIAIDVPISPWLYLCTLLLALLLGFGKRRHELVMMDSAAATTRASLEDYSLPVLDQVIAVVAAATLAAYAIYSINAPGAENSHALLLTVPVVAYAIFRYLHLVYRRHGGGSPEVMLVTDKPLRLAVLTWGIASIVIVSIAS